jgi:serine-type D-Ala-D-Ala carboxypeptidase/endopeptidase (penicillin-binding protein 4)
LNFFSVFASTRWMRFLILVLFSAQASLLCAQTSSESPLEAFRRAGIGADSVALYAVALDQITPKFSHNSDTPFVLASTTKIVTSLAALDILGSSFKWRTNAFLNGKLENGILAGDLLLVGGGDPLLTFDKLLQWFKLLQKRGLKEIAGNIILDRHRFTFSDKNASAGNTPDWRNAHHALPDAFVVNEGVVKIIIANAADGKSISIDPPIDTIEIVDQTQTLARCAAGKKPIAIEFDESTNNRKMIVTGDWAKDCGSQVVTATPLDQTTLSQATVLAAWKAAGGQITGGITEQAAPLQMTAKTAQSRRLTKAPKVMKARRPYATLDSKQLLDAVREVNKWSNNLISRNIFLSLSKGFPGTSASLAGAQSAIENWLLTKGFNVGDLVVENGSGLSRNEKGKARALGQLLREVSFTQIDKEFRSSMSVAGVDGTMGGRLKRSDMQGKIFIKTGTLSDVRAIAGYVTAKSGQIYAVVGLVNHPNATRAVPALDHFIEWVFAN